MESVIIVWKLCVHSAASFPSFTYKKEMTMMVIALKVNIILRNFSPEKKLSSPLYLEREFNEGKRVQRVRCLIIIIEEDLLIRIEECCIGPYTLMVVSSSFAIKNNTKPGRCNNLEKRGGEMNRDV